MFFRRSRKRAAAADDPAPSGEAEAPVDRESETLFDVRRAQREDQAQSWHDSWGRLSDRVGNFVRSRFRAKGLPPGMELDDLVETVFIRMLRDLPRLELKSRGAFWGWVAKLASNQLVDEWRRAGRRGATANPSAVGSEDVDLDPVANLADERAPTGSVMMRVNELEHAEAQCIARLTEMERRIYLARRVSRRSFPEIAKELGEASADTARAAFGRAKTKVLGCLSHKLDGYGPRFQAL